MGIEPTTTRLKVGCSTAELPALSTTRIVSGEAARTIGWVSLGSKAASGFPSQYVRAYDRDMRIVLLSLLLMAALVACTTLPADGSSQIQTSSQARRESIQGAMSSPLRDVNVMRTTIPDVLLAAMANPYLRPRPTNCASITAQILPLNGALGADLDDIAVDEDDLIERGRETALGAVAGAASGIIPFRGWVRQLSGAERHDKLVSAAIAAGAVRRAYLKGLGESRGCHPPATPLNAPPADPVAQTNGKPRFKTR